MVGLAIAEPWRGERGSIVPAVGRKESFAGKQANLLIGLTRQKTSVSSVVVGLRITLSVCITTPHNHFPMLDKGIPALSFSFISALLFLCPFYLQTSITPFPSLAMHSYSLC